jgi:peptidoglycan/LPS O-acetylase OafA/YrhL
VAPTQSQVEQRAAKQGEVAAASGYVAALDGVRALAIGAVFLLHLDRAHFEGGAIGVDLFFALSAYLITGILLEESATGAPRLSDFYWRRAFRLVPALAIWLVVIAIPTALSAHEAHLIPLSALGSVLYFNDFLEAFTHQVAAAFDQSWSLGVEEQFYLVWPALLLFGICRVRIMRQTPVFAILTAAAIFLLFRGGNYFLPTGHLLPLVLGAWAAWLKHRGWKPEWMSNVPGKAAGAAAVLFLLVAIVYTPHPGPGLSLWTVLVAFASVALIVLLECAPASAMSRLFGSSFPRWAGARSYGIYLYGLTLIALVGQTTHLRLHLAAPIIVLLTCVVAEISYRTAEAPIRRRGREWLRLRRQTQGTQAPVGTGPPS